MKVQESQFDWVGAPEAGRQDPEMAKLIDHRDEIDVLGGIVDPDADYSYDDWALCKLGKSYYLLSTSGCSCPSPSETWRIEIGPTTLKKIEQHITSGAYSGYTMPGKLEKEFLDLCKKAAQ